MHADARSYRRDAALFAVVLFAVLAATFAPFLFGSRTLLSSAAEVPSIYPQGATPSAPYRARGLDPGGQGWLSEPWAAVTHRMLFVLHEAPVWNADDGYGKPYAAGLEPQPFDPLTVALAAHPSPRTYAWFVASRLFVAGFFAALFIRLFTTARSGALAGGIATMLTGYYIVYYGMPHLSVDVGLPMLLWATELTVRRLTPARIATLAVACAPMYLGGGPESALLAVAVGAAYAVVRLRTASSKPLQSAGAIVAGNVLGVALAAVVLLPFFEYAAVSFNTHAPSVARGLGFDGNWPHGLFAELFPTAFGAPEYSTLPGGPWTGLRCFYGCAALFLGLVAVIAAARRRSAAAPAIFFLAAVALYAILKQFGSPWVLWTGALPGFRQIDFPKYLGFVGGDALGMLAGFGVAALRERFAGGRVVAGALALTLALISGLYVTTSADLPPGAVSTYAHGVALGLALLVAAALCSGACVRARSQTAATAAAALLCAVVALEPFASYIAPITWDAPPIADDSYAGAPYIGYLRDHVAGGDERVFGMDGVLYTQWPSAYGFSDPRSLGGLYLAGYLPFIDAFLSPASVPVGDDLADRFTAVRPLNVRSALFKRWLTLSSIGYVIEPLPGQAAFDEAVFPTVFKDGAVVRRVRGSLHRFTLYHRAQGVASADKARAAITAPGFDPHRDVVIEGTVPSLGAPSGAERAAVTAASDTSVTARVDVRAPALLMQNDAYYPGWIATIDGAPVPIVPADGFFRAVAIGPGHHVVTMRYASKRVAAGAWISLAALLLVIAGFAASAVRFRRSTAA